MEIEEITQHLIEITKHQQFTTESLIKMWVDEKKILNILRQNQRNWNYLTKELKKLVEDHDGLESYVTSNLSKRITTQENKGVSKKKHTQIYKGVDV